jgi:CubicO group peptidase (beta-lactamase class C family)
MRAPRSFAWFAVHALLALRIPAQTGPAGHWEGAIELPGSKLQVSVELFQAPDGAWTGSIDIPAQGAEDFPLEAIEVQDDRVGFAIKGVPGKPTFRGELALDGQVITGRFSQSGQTFDFRLARTASPKDATAKALEGFAAFVKGAMEEWKVPGCAVALVKGDEVVFCEGLGFRDAARKDPVSKDTLFAIGSCTKAFTALALAYLVEEGKLDWDTPVRTYAPDFRLKDQIATEQMTPRDLLTHSSGLPRHDLVWYGATHSRADLWDRLRFLDGNAGFRARWQYQNLMYLAAGHLMERISGKPWEHHMAWKIFRMIGMKRSNLSVVESQKSEDFARPCAEIDGAVREVPFRNIDAIGPAGSINSTSADMAQWVRLHLGGAPDGQQPISRATLAELHRPRMVMPDVSQDLEITNPAYALGWTVDSYRGRMRVQHGGNIDGFSAMVSLIPKDKVGAVVLANLDGTPLPEVVARTAIDRLMGLESIDWNRRLLTRVQAAKKAGAKAKDRADLARKKDTRPAHPPGDYAGVYEHSAYGRFEVSPAGDAGLAATFHGIPLSLEHWHYETFRARTEDPVLRDEKLFAQFLTNVRGDVDRVAIPLEPQVPEIIFHKKPPDLLFDPGFLRTLAGPYVMTDNPSVTATIAFKGEQVLCAQIPGQPEYILSPYQGTDFDLKGLTGYSLRFVLDGAGEVVELLFIQPNGVFAARKKTDGE